MKLNEITDRAAALKAIAEFDQLGREAFLAKYGFGPSVKLFVRHAGKLYDIKALAGATRGFASPSEGPLRYNEFSSGWPVMDLFRRLGFEVVDQSAHADGEPEPPPVASVLDIVRALRSRGFTFEPWHVAALVTALRTKPFAILAGISGTGKSQLPVLVGELTGAAVELIPVRPDWTDSADLLGFTNLQGEFVPRRLLQLAERASHDASRQYIAILDEMNLARVEQYFAEVLSLIEDRVRSEAGGYASRDALVPSAGKPWGAVGLPPNLAIVGTVNMDETTNGFSRKVLDRAFTLEMSEIDLTQWRPSGEELDTITPWQASRWWSRALRPSEIDEPSETDLVHINRTIDTLQDVNKLLTPAQLQVGYRVRDEIAMFLVNAEREADAFVASDGTPIDRLDLALNMKILPRVQGGSSAIRRVLSQLLIWANGGAPVTDDQSAADIAKGWMDAGRPAFMPGARFPRTIARLSLMWERLQNDGFTSYWL